jgi:hypothetical protein
MLKCTPEMQNQHQSPRPRRRSTRQTPVRLPLDAPSARAAHEARAGAERHLRLHSPRPHGDLQGPASNLARRNPSCPPPSLRSVRTMFAVYLALIAAGLAFYIVVGLTHH